MSPAAGRPSPSRRVVVRWWHVALGLGVVAVAGTLLVRGLRAPRGPRPPSASEDGLPPATAVAGPEEADVALAAMPRRAVTLYWPDSETGLLAEREAEIFATTSRIDQLKQVVGLLLAGPEQAPAGAGEGSDDGDGGAGSATDDEAGAAGTLRAPLPPGTALRHVFLDPWGVAHVSLTEAARSAAPGGTDWERLAVGSLANSLVRSFPEVRGLRLLVEGQEVDTLAGHLDLTRPIAFDDALVAAAR